MALRADASARSGLGHVIRTLALGQALRELGCEVYLVSRHLGVDTGSLARRAGIAHITLPDPNSDTVDVEPPEPIGDADRTVACLAAWRPDVIVVDHYGLDTRWHGEVLSRLPARIAAIDDLADRNLVADWVIDHNPSDDPAAKYRGRVRPTCRILGGPRYALLAPAYREVARRRLFHPEVRSVGIFMGGTDAIDATSTALRACREGARFAGPIEIATTSANPNLKSLRNLCGLWPDTHLVVDADDLSGFFGRHDLHVGAGGGAAWERCCLGAPTLAIACAANQRVVIDPLSALGVVATLPDGVSPDAGTIGAAVAALVNDPQRRRDMSERGQALVDGLGARRVALRLAGSAVLTVRAATPGDARMIHTWRNDPATRRTSINSHEITWENHLGWLTATLDDPQRVLLVAQAGPIPVGVIRFDRSEPGTAEVSLYLDPALHGLGLGASMLAAGERHMALLPHPPREVIATVLETNAASQQMFRSAGYRLSGSHWAKSASASTGEPRA